MATIIDSLIVTLGLNNGPYIKSAKEAEAQQKKFRESTKKTGNEVSDALAGVGKAAAGLFLGFESIKGAISFFAGLTTQTAAMGRFAANVGQSSKAVGAWDNAVELAGGSAQDAEADIQKLSQSITDLKATGTVSSLLLLFQRLGVSIYDAQGKTRNLTDVYKDAGDKLRQFNRADAASLARGAGISDSTLNLIIATNEKRQEYIDKGEEANKVDERAVQQAQDLQQAWRGIGQEVKGAGVTILTDFAGPVKEAFDWVQKLFASASKSKPLQQAFSIIGGLIHSVVSVVKLAFNGLELLGHTKIVQWVLSLGSKLLGLTGDLQSSVNATLDDYVKDAQDANAAGSTPAGNPRKGIIQRGGNSVNNNPGNLRYAGQAGATNENGFAAFPTLAAGIQAANSQLDRYAKRGINTIQDIIRTWAPPGENDTEAYIKDAERRVGKGRNAQLSAADRQKLLQAIFGHEGRAKVGAGDITSALGANPGALASANLANRVSSDANKTNGGSTSTTTVQIDGITVNTQATDADGIAAELPAAVKRKGIVAQADTGMS